MYKIEESVMQSKELSPAHKLVYAVIAKHCIEAEGVNLPYEKIADSTNLTQMTVIRAVKALEKAVLIKIGQNARGWNCYEVVGK